MKSVLKTRLRNAWIVHPKRTDLSIVIQQKICCVSQPKKHRKKCMIKRFLFYRKLSQKAMIYRLKKRSTVIIVALMMPVCFAHQSLSYARMTTNQEKKANATVSAPQSKTLARIQAILFYKGSCPYCKQFLPILNVVLKHRGIPVISFTLDGEMDASYPTAEIPDSIILHKFFETKPIRVPSVFLMDTKRGLLFPLSVGALTQEAMEARLDQVLGYIQSDEVSHV